MYNFENYLSNKNALISKIDSVKTKISELSDLGIDISDSIKKLDNASKIIQHDKISVVLVGAFSDGKTSVAAGWINEKLDNMKIDSDESSDEILCYNPTSIPDGCQIVDTPGLFGDKIGDDENGHKILLSDLTKKFISEANLILYVVPAKNPIKDSHKECIKWILKDLNKLGSTIFVINRMDDVADLTDEEDFSFQAKIKTKNLRDKLLECGLNSEEVEKVKVACISAAPDKKGIEVWKDHRDEYLKRSHLSALENLTNSILADTRENLITKTGCDILNDELTKTINLIKLQEDDIATIIIPEQKETLKRNKKDLDDLRKRILISRNDLKCDLHSLEKKKILVIRSATMENFKDVMEDEIGIIPGKEGYRLNDEINDIFQKYLEKTACQTKALGEKFQAEYDKQNEAVESLLKKCVGAAANGLKGAGKISVNAFKSGIFAGRELLEKLGIVVKFKPWQVTKMASFATKALPVIGAAIDVISNIVENIAAQERNKKFETQKNEIKESISETFQEIVESLNNTDEFINTYAPDFRILEKQIKQDESDIKGREKILSDFKKWKNDAIDVDFTIA
jgi:predicted GTPase